MQQQTALFVVQSTTCLIERGEVSKATHSLTCCYTVAPIAVSMARSTSIEKCKNTHDDTQLSTTTSLLDKRCYNPLPCRQRKCSTLFTIVTLVCNYTIRTAACLRPRLGQCYTGSKVERLHGRDSPTVRHTVATANYKSSTHTVHIREAHLLSHLVASYRTQQQTTISTYRPATIRRILTI